MIRHLASVVALAFVLVSCTRTPVTTTTTTTPPTTSTTSTTVATTTSTVPVGIDALSQDLQAEVVALVEATERIRELEFLEPPTITVLDPEALAERVREIVQEELENIPAEQALYRLLGLIGRDLDLGGLYSELYGEQVAGFYDGDTRELVVATTEEGFSPLERATLVHELAHALTDQHFDYWPRYSEMIEDQRYDEAAGFLALMEGDATLTQIVYLQQLDSAERQAALAESLLADQAVFDSAPSFIQGSLIFPYQSGFSFVQRLFDLAGFELVNEAYLDPPASTEQILTPRDYGEDLPLTVEHNEISVEGYERVFDSVWGELSFSLMFEQHLGGASTAVEGWGGDRFTVLFDGENAVMYLTYRGDTEQDAVEMFSALEEYITAAMAIDESEELGSWVVYRGEDVVMLRLDSDTVVFAAASDPGLEETLLAAG